MAISTTVKKGYITLKTAASTYVKLLPRTLASLVTTDSGSNVQDELDELNSNLNTYNKFSIDTSDTGEVWTNGRKIYRQTFLTTDTIPANGSLTIPLDIAGVSGIWIDTQNSFIASGNNDQIYPLPLVAYGGDTSENIGVWCNAAGIRLRSTKGGWNSAWTKVVTVKYTV